MKTPARKMKPSAVKNICLFASVKSEKGKIHRVESLLEKDFCYHLDFAKNVLDFETQPETFSLFDEVTKKYNRYTPDFLVHFSDGKKVYFEVKPRSENLKKAYMAKLDLFREYCDIRGYTFEIVTRDEISQKPLVQNFQLLHKYLRAGIEKPDLRLLEALKSQHPSGTNFQKIVQALNPSQLVEIYKLLAVSLLKFDMETIYIADNPEVAL